MTINAFGDLLNNSNEFRAAVGDIKSRRVPLALLSLTSTVKAMVAAGLFMHLGRQLLIFAPDENTCSHMASDIRALGVRAFVYPEKNLVFRAGDSDSREFEHRRLAVLRAICSGEADIIMTTPAAASQYTIPKTELKKRTVTLRLGEDSGIDDLARFFSSAGYVRRDTVDGPGLFAVRGGIVDFFPVDSDAPVRAEFWGSSPDTMGHFDILTQRKTDTLREALITPSMETTVDDVSGLARRIRGLASTLRGRNAPAARQFLNADADELERGSIPDSIDKYLPLIYETRATLFDYLPDAHLIVCESNAVKEKAEASEKLYLEDVKSGFDDGYLCKGLDEYRLPWSLIHSGYTERGVIYMNDFAPGTYDTPLKDLINFNIHRTAAWNGSISQLEDDLKPALRRGMTAIVFAGNDKASVSLAQDLSDAGYDCVYHPSLPARFIGKCVNIIEGGLSSGLEFNTEKFIIFSYTKGARQSFKREAARSRKKSAEAFQNISELTRGDYVVHSKYGIGIFDGIQKDTAAGITRDYIRIKYAGSDVLKIPVTQLDLVSKYIGPKSDDSGVRVKINRLGGADWENTKKKVSRAAEEIAQELIKLYSQRLHSKGFSFDADDDLQSDFESRFEYEETDDQLRCSREIKADMEASHPMDRLLCGDVGFGKTEVALRAAFKCVSQGKQCAILVPTTILALQHYQTMLRRFEGFPINIEMLSRFRTGEEQKKIIKRLAAPDMVDGMVDLIVGTHRLLSKDIKFRDLGLLIVDEEQRFGVKQKEKIKELFPSVDVLTLSATPIPRTLNMAMVGIRDLSVIEESPADRLPIQSFVLPYDDEVVARAVDRELRRGGQVYYLHNNIGDITDTAAHLQKLVPDARIEVAHGKMGENEMSAVWKRLLDGEIDVLVCTTIIETGIDVPNVNTLIIENSQRLGLAQLHQIRGRVGRSSRRASAYFTFPPDRSINEEAQQRLDAIREYTQFGSGFNIAMRDLEIRGAGNLLGASQHGHMAAVGYDMYIKILNEAVEKAAADGASAQASGDRAALHEKECVIDLQIDAHMPERYITNTSHRLSVYRRIAEIRSPEDAMDVRDELIDRFGDPPKEVEGLITVSLLRNEAQKFGIYKITQAYGNLLFYVNKIDMDLVGRLVEALPRRVMITATGTKPYITVKQKSGSGPIECMREFFDIAERS